MKKDHSYCRYFRPHLWKIVVALLLSAITTAGNFASTHTLSICVDNISESNLWCFLLVWLAIEFITKVVSFLASRVILGIKVKVIQDIRWKLLRTAAEASVESVRKVDPVDLATRTGEEALLYVDAIHSIYGEIFSIALGLLALGYTGYHSWQLLLLLIISFMVILGVQYFTIKKIVSAESKAKEASVSSRSLLVQAFQAFEDLKVQRLTRGIKAHVDDTLTSEVQTNVSAQKIVLTNNLVSETLSTIMQGAFIALAGFLILSSQLSFGTFVALFMYKGYIYGLVGCILRLVKFKSKSDTSTKRMNAILNNEILAKDVWGETHLPNPSGEIIIKDLTVNYGDIKVIDNLSVTLPSSSFIGIVGDSGCGKSTLLKVLAKAESATSGSIQMDGVELSELNEWSYRKAITLAPQQPFLFDFSIKQNLLLANPEASDGAIWDALKQCSADGFVREKGGLDTLLSPKELSGGQRQRLALARIPLRGGKVVLLDESTSALDGESQALVLRTIREAADMGHTMMLVAHRVSTLKTADLILVMEDGKVLETGTYDELYDRSEKFRRLANLG